MLITVRGGEGPLYRRIYLSLKDAIRAGRLGPQARLPSTRALAGDLGVSRNTVVLAYEQLAAEGYLISRNRAAAAVAEGPVPVVKVPISSKPPPRVSAYARRLSGKTGSSSFALRPGIRYDYRYGRPPADEFPRQIWRRLM